jgi:hypothetical protein
VAVSVVEGSESVNGRVIVATPPEFTRTGSVVGVAVIMPTTKDKTTFAYFSDDPFPDSSRPFYFIQSN